MVKKLLLLCLSIALHGCYEGTEFRPVPIGPAGEGTAPTQSYRGAAPQQSVPPNAMLDDPESKTEDWEEETFANSPADAEARCQQMAENRSRSGAVVHSRGAYQVSGKLYRCKFTSEVSDGNSN